MLSSIVFIGNVKMVDVYIDQAATLCSCAAICLLLITNLFLSLKAFKSSINRFLSSLSKRATNLLVDGLL